MTKRQPPPGISDQDWKATPPSVQTVVYTLLRVVDELQQVVAQSQKRISQLEEQVAVRVTEGQPLMKLEAMKMEHTIRTAAAGIVEAIYFQAGDTVEADAQLLKIGAVETP